MIEYQIKENQPAGQIIGKVFDNIKSNSNPIWFVTTEDSLRFVLSEENELFDLDSKTGFLKSKKVIDLEELCPKHCVNQRGLIKLSVNIWFMDKLQGIAKVSIAIVDLNDNFPFFDQPEFRISIKEMVYTAGKTIDLPRAIDRDIADINNAIDYKLNTQSIFFDLKIKNKIQPFLILKRTMDSEEIDFFELVLLAWNTNFYNSKPAELKIIINILDINDNEPVFDKAIYLVPVPETAMVGSTIYQVRASDPDKNSRLIYSSIPETPSSISSMFMTESNGSIRLLRSLDYETQQFYQMSVRVSDGEFNAFTKVKIVVMDINDEAPQFIINPNRIYVFENSKVGEIAQLSVIDRDSADINGVIVCFEPEDIATKQIVTFIAHPINNLLFTLQLTRTLDRDTTGGDIQYAQLICHDNGIPTSLTSTYTVTIHVKDRNDNLPIFREFLTNITVRENSPIIDILYKVQATDKDRDENGQIKYAVLANCTDDVCCVIDSNTGALYSKKPFDREIRSLYKIIITATDQSLSEPRFTSYLTINITILDENDEVPRLVEPYNLTVKENEPPGVLIGNLVAIDKDIDENGHVKFSLIPGPKSNYFDLHSNGSLYSRNTFDREEKENYCIPINMEDMGSPVSNVVKTTVCVTILDKNDNAPTILLPNFVKIANQSQQINTDASYQINISIYSLLQHPFAKINVDDLDRDQNANVTLNLIPDTAENGRIAHIISLDDDLRQLSLVESPHISDVGCYKYKLIAIDAGEPKLSTKKNLIICLTEKVINTSFQEKDRDHTVSKANILIVVILAGTSAFLTALLVSAILCMVQPCKHFRRRHLLQSQNVTDTSAPNNQDDIMMNVQRRSKNKESEFFDEKLLKDKIDCDQKPGDRSINNHSWSCKLLSDRENKYTNLVRMHPQFVAGSEEQRSDSGRGASDEDNIIPPLSHLSRLSQFNPTFEMKPLVSTQLCSSKDFLGTKVLENCGCEYIRQSSLCPIPKILQSSLNLNSLKMLSNVTHINTGNDMISTSTNFMPHNSHDFILENSLYTDSCVSNPNVIYPLDLSMQNVADLSTHIDKLFFSQCCKKY